MKLEHAIALARPSHWLKNILVLLPVVFALRMTDADAWRLAGLAAAAFCLISSGVYVINDIVDRRADAMHPRKRSRPLASGRAGAGAALVEALALLAAGMVGAWAVGRPLACVAGAYVLLQLAYTFALKRRIILDVICIAIGFVLRAVGGAVAIDAAISPWLVVCTFTACLFLGFSKRCNERATLGASARAENHRNTLGEYSGDLLTHLITLSGAIAVVSFLLYASSVRTRAHIGTISLVYTLPLVIYAVFRFAMLSMRGRYADPMDIILHDWPLQVTAAGWLVSSACIVQWGQELGTWLGS